MWSVVQCAKGSSVAIYKKKPFLIANTKHARNSKAFSCASQFKERSSRKTQQYNHGSCQKSLSFSGYQPYASQRLEYIIIYLETHSGNRYQKHQGHCPVCRTKQTRTKDGVFLACMRLNRERIRTSFQHRTSITPLPVSGFSLSTAYRRGRKLT